MKQSIYLRNSVQRQNGEYQLYTREQMPQEQLQSSEEDRDSTVAACTGSDAIQDCAHDAGNDLQRARYSQSAVVRIVKGTARAWRIERLQYEFREIISPASNKQAMGWKPNTANMRRSCRVKETSRAKSVRHEESNKIAIVLNSSHQLKIPEHILNRNRSSQDITEV